MSEDTDRAFIRKLLMAKALGFTNAISKLSREERNQNPSGTYGSDYNTLRESVAEEFPVLRAFLPPAVSVGDSSYGGATFTIEKYGEIFTFCEQIFHLLDTAGEA